MKIGIVTVYDSSNCGSFLQSYALKEYLESEGFDVSFIQLRSEEDLKKLYYDNGLLIRSIIKYPVIGIKRYLFARKKYSIYLEELHKYFKIINKSEARKMDAIILGSDEIWNVQTSTFQNPIFYGKGLNKVLTYAVCSGRATSDDLRKFPELVKCIQNLSNILVRDEHTQSTVQNLTGYVPSCVCDPTFLINRDHYRTELCKKLTNTKYLLLYAYGISKYIKKHIKRYAKEKGLKIVSASLFTMWADYNVNCAPIELFSLMENAECVITTTFHGTVFSILSHSHFISIPGGSINKVSDLLKRTGLEKHLVVEDINYDKFSCILDTSVDYALVDKNIEKYKNYSAEKLKEGIRGQANEEY